METYMTFVQVAFSNLLQNICELLNSGEMTADVAIKILDEQQKHIALSCDEE